MVSIRAGRLRRPSTRSTPGGEIPEPILLVSARPAMGCDQECVHLYSSFDPDGLFSRDTEPSRNNRKSFRLSKVPSFRDHTDRLSRPSAPRSIGATRPGTSLRQL